MSGRQKSQLLGLLLAYSRASYFGLQITMVPEGIVLVLDLCVRSGCVGEEGQMEQVRLPSVD